MSRIVITGVLQVSPVASVYHVCELAVYFVVGQMDTAPDVLERRARIVGNLLLGDDTAVDLILERRQRLQRGEVFLQTVGDLIIVF